MVIDISYIELVWTAAVNLSQISPRNKNIKAILASKKKKKHFLVTQKSKIVELEPSVSSANFSKYIFLGVFYVCVTFLIQYKNIYH